MHSYFLLDEVSRVHERLRWLSSHWISSVGFHWICTSGLPECYGWYMRPQDSKSCKVWLCIIATLNKGQMLVWHVVFLEVKHSLLLGNKLIARPFYYSLALLSTELVFYYKRLRWGLLHDWTGLCRSVSQLWSWSAVGFVTTDCAVTCSNLIGHFQ